MTRFPLLLGALASFLSLASCFRVVEPAGVSMGEFEEVSDFSFTTQEGETLSLANLKGKIWIANFVFTSCGAECLVLSSRVAELQRLFAKEEDVAFVSFSVDPQTDTPERLETFANRWHADPEAWHFLTGEPDALDAIVRNSFLLPVTRDPEELAKLQATNLIHSSKFAIVDREGIVRAYVEGLPETSVSVISRIVVQLLQETDTDDSLSKSTPNY